MFCALCPLGLTYQQAARSNDVGARVNLMLFTLFSCLYAYTYIHMPHFCNFIFVRNTFTLFGPFWVVQRHSVGAQQYILEDTRMYHLVIIIHRDNACFV